MIKLSLFIGISIFVISCGNSFTGDIRFYSYYIDFELLSSKYGNSYAFTKNDSLLKSNHISNSEFDDFKQDIKKNPQNLNKFLIFIKDCLTAENELIKNGENLKKQRLKDFKTKANRLYYYNLKLRKKNWEKKNVNNSSNRFKQLKSRKTRTGETRKQNRILRRPIKTGQFIPKRGS